MIYDTASFLCDDFGKEAISKILSAMIFFSKFDYDTHYCKIK